MPFSIGIDINAAVIIEAQKRNIKYIKHTRFLHGNVNNLDSVKLSLEAQILPAGTKPIKIAIGMGAMNRCVLNGTLESLHVLQQLWRLGCDHVLLTGHTPTLVTRVMAEAVGFVPEIQTFNPTNPKLEPNASFNGAVDCIILRRMTQEERRAYLAKKRFQVDQLP